MWAVVLPITSFAASRPARLWHSLAFVVYGVGSVVCHQLPARSFQLWAAQMPVCARCTGIYVGAAIVAVIDMVRPERTVRLKPDATYAPDATRMLLAIASLPTALTLVYEWTMGDVPSNVIRALAGVPLGAAVALVIAGSLTGARKVN